MLFVHYLDIKLKINLVLIQILKILLIKVYENNLITMYYL